MKKTILLLLCLGILMGWLAGCQKPAQKPQTLQPESSGLTTSDCRVISDKLSKQARQIDGVGKATVILSEDKGSQNVTPSPTPGQTQVKGLTVMVGITLGSGADGNTVKRKVTQKLKETDSRVSRVMVTTDPNLIKKIDEVAAALIEGKPIQTMKERIDAISQQIQKERPNS